MDLRNVKCPILVTFRLKVTTMIPKASIDGSFKLLNTYLYKFVFCFVLF